MQHQYNKSFRVHTPFGCNESTWYAHLFSIPAALLASQLPTGDYLNAITAPDYMIQPEFSVQKFSFPTSGITVRKSPCSVGHERLMQWNNMMKSWKLKYKWRRAIIRRLSSELSSTILLPLAGPDHIKRTTRASVMTASQHRNPGGSHENSTAEASILSTFLCQEIGEPLIRVAKQTNN